MPMLDALRNSLRLPGLRKRLLFTAFMLVILRIGAHVSVPGVDIYRAQSLFTAGGFLGIVDLFAGGAFQSFAIFAMSVTPYINASIIVQLLTVVIPKWEEMQKEGGEEGRKKLQQYTRYLTVLLGLIQAFGIGTYVRAQGAFINDSWWTLALVMVSLMAGSTFLMWMGEMITEKGIGNGTSMIIFANIITRVPAALAGLFQLVKAGAVNPFQVGLVGVIAVAMVAFVVLMTEAVRKIPSHYTKQLVGRKVYGGQSTFLPVKINQAGVIPVIFANSLLYLPITIAGFFPDTKFAIFVKQYFGGGQVWFWVAEFVFIIFFTYFYTAITFNPQDIADNLKKNGGFIPSIRPGKPTAEYLGKVSEHLTLVGALFLGALTVLPVLIVALTNVEAARLGGTAILIVVGVALDTMKQIESQAVVRKYQGFMRS
jgi:preprotein translocase subunit SecY